MSKNAREIREYAGGYLWWAGQEVGRVLGVTELAITDLGDMEGVDLPEPGQEFSDGDIMGELTGRNQSIEITAPFKLRVEEVGDTELLADDPTGDAWLLRVSPLGEDD